MTNYDPVDCNDSADFCIALMQTYPEYTSADAARLRDERHPIWKQWCEARSLVQSMSGKYRGQISGNQMGEK